MPDFPPVNFQRLRPSRARLTAGDLFTMRLLDDRYLFGRVVRTDARCFAPGCLLVYVFGYLASEPSPPPRLLVKDLLIPPAMINRLGWSRGYFVTLERREFEDGERLPVHYFDNGFPSRQNERYEDEDQHALGPPPEGTLVGPAGLGNYRTIDDAVSGALGIPLAPDRDVEAVAGN